MGNNDYGCEYDDDNEWRESVRVERGELRERESSNTAIA